MMSNDKKCIYLYIHTGYHSCILFIFLYILLLCFVHHGGGDGGGGAGGELRYRQRVRRRVYRSEHSGNRECECSASQR